MQSGRYWIAYATSRPTFVKYIGLSGSLNNIILNAGQTTAYASEDNADKIAIINTATTSPPRSTRSRRPTSSARCCAIPGRRPTIWSSAKTRGFDWSAEDRVPAGLFNRILWEGLKGTPYPALRTHTALGVHEAAGQDATDND